MNARTNIVSVGIKLFCIEGTIDKIDRAIRSSIHSVRKVGGQIEITFSFYKDALAVRRLIEKMTSELARKEALAVQSFAKKMASRSSRNSLMLVAA
jgi:hypothetical protein